ncbi:glycogen debranching protein [Photobacterium gaetbulicola]|uniref:Glycogen debranching enzyme n=1 Tax=Photobacterium gaetbulicola Gung47 TaxID=658445 RepID=A0A0C5W1Z9_9GAMM|nr:amylo-alpha-1,6-glucosidase [Photobacterium gaetbulicola]AJR05391.1 glycogen debranching enzyme [Photobacterium gaetbulicola Gung47]PSU12713.1 glycogen debranching protein [Photobacterium gaetbulicola]
MSTIEQAPFTEQLYVKGTFNGWGDDTPMNYIGDGCYQAVVCFSADLHNFKISDQQGTEAFSFAADKYKAVACELKQPQTLIPAKGIGNDLTFMAPDTGLYTISVRVSDDKVEMVIEAGGENLDSEPNRALFDAGFSVEAGRGDVTGKGNKVLSPEQLFSELAISVEQSAPFVFGDNIDGYFDGVTHGYVAAGKYRHKQGWYLGAMASFVDGVLNDKTIAEEARIYPYGVTHGFTGGSGNDIEETFMLFSGQDSRQRSAAITVKSAEPAVLAIAPQLNLAMDSSSVKAFDGGVVYALSEELRQAGTPSFIALCANKSFSFSETTFGETPALKNKVHLSGHHVKPLLTSTDPQAEMTVYLAFAETEAEAIAHASSLVKQDGVSIHLQQVYDMLTHSYVWTSDREYNRALMWAKAAGKVFVSTEFGKGIWAGLPWFKDCWGRDSFIAVPGITLVNGDFADAKTIIDNFASMQLTDESNVNFGRIPNRVTSLTNIIYNTTDGTPWMVREVWDYLRYSGDKGYAKAIYPVVQTYIAGIEKHYLDEHGLMTHRDPDTWMDAKLEGKLPWSARGTRANDIQALWFTSLLVAVELAKLTGDEQSAEYYQQMAKRVSESFQKLFWDQEQQKLADRLYADDQRDLQVRSNQLMTVTVPFDNGLLDKNIGAKVVKNAVSELLFPWGITSLSQYDPIFHPYHANRDEYHKDAAYHNGTIWGWNAGFTVSSLIEYGYADFAYQLTKNLSEQILYLGHRGAMSENLDAFLNQEGGLTTTGTYAQAWSVSEFTRNGYQDYIGFKPELLADKVVLAPCLPSSWKQFDAELRFGESNALSVSYQFTDQGLQRFELAYKETSFSQAVAVQLDLHLMAQDKAKYQLVLVPDELPAVIEFDPAVASVVVNGKQRDLVQIQPSYAAVIGDLAFAKPDLSLAFPVLQGQHVLQQQVENADLVQATD